MFKVGDDVVCVDARTIPGYGNSGLVTGKTYRISWASRTCVSIYGEHDGPGLCKSCNVDDDMAHFPPWRFVKLPKQSVEYKQKAEA